MCHSGFVENQVSLGAVLGGQEQPGLSPQCWLGSEVHSEEVQACLLVVAAVLWEDCGRWRWGLMVRCGPKGAEEERLSGSTSFQQKTLFL